MVPNDKEEWMLVAYAQAIGLLAASAHQYLLNSLNANPSPESQVCTWHQHSLIEDQCLSLFCTPFFGQASHRAHRASETAEWKP